MTPPSATVLDAVFKAYDVRGLVDSQLDPGLVEAVGAAAAEVLVDGEGAMVVGRDMRPSSPMLVEAFVAGVTSRGVDVVDIGLASTDQLTYASGALALPGAMFTASHNPAAYNGIKLCRSGARPVSIDSGLAQIRDLAAAGVPATSAASGTRRAHDVLGRFAAHARSFVDIDAIGSVSVAVDAGNGMAGHVWPAVVAGTAIDTQPLFFELDGTFPNHPANPQNSGCVSIAVPATTA